MSLYLSAARSGSGSSQARKVANPSTLAAPSTSCFGRVTACARYPRGTLLAIAREGGGNGSGGIRASSFQDVVSARFERFAPGLAGVAGEALGRTRWSQLHNGGSACPGAARPGALLAGRDRWAPRLQHPGRPRVLPRSSKVAPRGGGPEPAGRGRCPPRGRVRPLRSGPGRAFRGRHPRGHDAKGPASVARLYLPLEALRREVPLQPPPARGAEPPRRLRSRGRAHPGAQRAHRAVAS